MATPTTLLRKQLPENLKDFTPPTSHTVRKCPVYLHLPWLGTFSVRLENKIKASVENASLQ